VIVGGGPTGVELAGAIAEIARETLKHDFRSIDPMKTRVLLIENGDRVLGQFSPESSAAAAQQLERIGVEILPGRKVTGITSESVQIGEETIRARSTFWTAGVQAAPLSRALKGLGEALDRAGRVPVEADLSVPGFPEVFVIGDMALFLHQPGPDGKPTGKPLPGVAPVAMQHGKHAGKNIAHSVRGEARVPFKYWDKGNMATIGRAAAVAEIGERRFKGFIAWLMWVFVHVYFLIGFYNRALVLFRWGWSYITYQRGSRLITMVNQPASHPHAASTDVAAAPAPTVASPDGTVSGRIIDPPGMSPDGAASVSAAPKS
jgi:NADH dehydrogenase